uniref:AMP-binding protein n=1 Tax=Stenotrophomonas indicatrix TaxID=2045451 RepID=UPI003CD006C7
LVTVGRRLGWGGTTLAALERAGANSGPMLADTDGEDTAAILFTSGSTGVPKGVVYRHRHFVGQIELLGSAFGMEAGGVDRSGTGPDLGDSGHGPDPAGPGRPGAPA